MVWLSKSCSFVYQFVEQIKVDHSFNKITKLGKKWIMMFCATRKSECSARNRVQVTRFSENLQQLIEKYSLPRKPIFNMDAIVPNKTPKVLSLKGKKTRKSRIRGMRTIGYCSLLYKRQKILCTTHINLSKKTKEKRIASWSTMMLSHSGFLNFKLFVKRL